MEKSAKIKAISNQHQPSLLKKGREIQKCISEIETFSFFMTDMRLWSMFDKLACFCVFDWNEQVHYNENCLRRERAAHNGPHFSLKQVMDVNSCKTRFNYCERKNVAPSKVKAPPPAAPLCKAGADFPDKNRNRLLHKSHVNEPISAQKNSRPALNTTWVQTWKSENSQTSFPLWQLTCARDHTILTLRCVMDTFGKIEGKTYQCKVCKKKGKSIEFGH